MQALLLCPQFKPDEITGPVKRAKQIQRLLEHSGYSVTIACKTPSSELCIAQHGRQFEESLKKCSLVYADSYHMGSFRIGQRTKAFKLVDLYIPFFIEHKYSLPHRYENEEVITKFQIDQLYLTQALSKGDAFLASGSRQIDLFSGLLHLFNNDYHKDLPILDLPFVIDPCSSSKPKKKIKHIAWIGGAWHWFDLVSVVQCFRKLLSENSGLKFSLVGIEHPTDPRLHDSRQILEARKLVQDFPDQVTKIPWMNYTDYCDWLQELDLAIVFGKAGRESHFSIRTRFTELLERQIPIICNSGDYFSDWIEKYELGSIIEVKNLQNSLQNWISGNHESTPKYDKFFEKHGFDTMLLRFQTFLNSCQSAKIATPNPYLNLKPKSLYLIRYKLKKLLLALSRKWRQK